MDRPIIPALPTLRRLSRMLRHSGWLLATSIAWAQPLPPDNMDARVQPCAACHGESGRVAADEDYFPSIAGKPAGYLYEQMINFRHGRRQHDIMQAMFAVLSEGYLNEIAVYYAAQTPKLHSPTRLSEPDAGEIEMLIRHGDATRNLPACTACHGDDLVGAKPTIPGLLGLRSEYLAAQLGAWREGTRRAAAPDCMHTVAIRLSPAEIDRVSRWLASQPYPRNAKPLPQLPDPLPLPCGASR